MSTRGYLAHIERSPGRHGISNAFFLHVRDPRHRVELCCSDYQTCDRDQQPIRWDLKDPLRQASGAPPLRAGWFEEGSLLTGVAAREAGLRATSIVAP